MRTVLSVKRCLTLCASLVCLAAHGQGLTASPSQTGKSTGSPASADTAAKPKARTQRMGLHVPPRGSAERREVLDGLRAVVMPDRPHDIIFVVRELRVHGDWAWVSADPRSRDGSQNYERESALLQRTNSGWKVVDRMLALGEREGTPLEKNTAYYQHLRKRFPAVPADVFPRR